MTDTTGMVKVGLYGPDGEFETMWATPVGEHRYRLENSPFYAYSVSWLDIVEARPESDEPSAFPVFERVVEKSGHRTLRLILVPGIDEDPARKRVLEDLAALGCTYEGYNPRYFVLDIAPEHDLARVVHYLNGNALDWEYVDPSYEELFPDEP
jgi:Domain of unknown function (DUF4265)